VALAAVPPDEAGRPGATDPASVAREARPSWARYTIEDERTLSLESLTLLDGLVSYLAAIALNHAPRARWEIARDRVKRYVYNNHPVLVSGRGDVHNFLPDVPVAQARASVRGTRESPEDRIAAYTRNLIEQLHQAESVTGEAEEAEPLLEIEDIRDEPGGYDFEIGLSAELAHGRSRDLDRLVSELSGEDGVKKVLREDRDMVLVRAPSWSADKLETWILRRL
jgi:hypothetical protein